MTEPDRRDRGRVFNEVPELYDRVRPAYPDELFAGLVAISGMHRRSQVLEVGCGTGQAARSRRHEAGHEAVPVGLVAARPVLPAGHGDLGAAHGIVHLESAFGLVRTGS